MERQGRGTRQRKPAPGLLEIRKAFGPDLANLVTADKRTVKLCLDNVRVDRLELAADPAALRDRLEARDSASLELLEGIDIRDPEFEDWLTLERSVWAEIADAARKTPRMPQASAPRAADQTPAPDQTTRDEPQLARISVGLLPGMTSGVSTVHATIADVLVDTIARNINEIQPIDIFDFRSVGNAEEASMPGGQGPEWLIRLRITPLGEALNLTLLVYRSTSMKLVWSNAMSGAEGEALQLDSPLIGNFLAQCVDRLARTLFETSGTLAPREIAARASYTALNLMFRVNRDSLDNAEKILKDSNKDEPQASALALMSYISSFRIGDNLGPYDAAHREATELMAKAALDVDPYNSLSLSCLGHVAGYVLRRFDAAGELLHRAVTLNPHQAFAWDHFALYNLYVGDIDQALIASKNAVLLGSYSPLRFAYETTLLMVSTVAGDLRTAVYYGERALSRQPHYQPAKRYLIAAHALSGGAERSEELLRDLQAQNHSFSLDSIKGDSFALMRENDKSRLISAYRMAGLR